MRLLVATLVLLCSCAHHRHKAPPVADEPITCATVGVIPQAPAPDLAPPPPTMSFPSDKQSHIEIQCEPPPKEGSRLCRFDARWATLTEVAVALADATGLSVSIDPQMLSVRVSAVMTRATADQFLAVISDTSFEVAKDNELVRFVPIGYAVHQMKRARLVESDSSLKVRLIPMSHAISKRQLVSAVCSMLSDRGEVHVVEDLMIVKDSRFYLTKAEILVRTVDWHSARNAVADRLRQIASEPSPARKQELLTAACKSASMNVGEVVVADGATAKLGAAILEKEEIRWIAAVAEACPPAPVEHGESLEMEE